MRGFPICQDDLSTAVGAVALLPMPPEFFARARAETSQ
jgi:hypothetical protein